MSSLNTETLPSVPDSSVRDDEKKGKARLLRRVVKLSAVVLVVLLGAGAVLWARSRPVRVERTFVKRGFVASEVMGTGTLEAKVSAVISPRLAGLLTNVLVDQGDRVSRGQLLATLYVGDLNEQARVADADVKVALAAIDQANAQISAASATAQEARSSFGRVSRLVEHGVVSHDEFDKAIKGRDVAEADLQRTRMNEVGASRQVLKAKAAARSTRERLADTRILAPFDGYVIKRTRDPGNIAVPGDSILQLISLDTLWVSAWVDETAMSRVALGQPARVIFRSEPGKTYEGTVARIEPQVDPETREFLVDVKVAKLPTNWGIGQRAEVYIQTAKRDNALRIPVRAVVQRNGHPGVFVDVSGRAHWRPVEFGLHGRDVIEVVSGLGDGIPIVWPPEMPAKVILADGRRVQGS
jgi:HlyD family secretion protein